MKEIISIPNASRTFDALRSLGYDLNSSLADVVDNAVTEKVGAKKVAIDFSFDFNRKISCRILDNGCGMNEVELEEAMRLGTDTAYEEGDLGKFGMGMKTASLSHCNILTVISKKKRSDIVGYRWDIGQIKKKGWTLLKLNASEINHIMTSENIILDSHGTAVFWNDMFWLDQEFESYHSEKLSQNYYYRILESLKLHLRMVYHRFLDGSLDDGKVEIKINNKPLTPWDPFCLDEPKTEKINLKKEYSELKISGHKIPIYINAYVLPNKEGFSSDQAWKEAKGLLSWNDSQGYYIYRANRIIRFGGWQGTKAKDEHDKLARISIDLDSSLDTLFHMTVNKSKVQFPEVLYHHLKNTVNPLVVKKAKSIYNKSEDNLTVKNNFRKSGVEVSRVSKELISDSKIKTNNSTKDRPDSIQVQNPSGTWLSNKIHDFLKYGSDKDYEIVSANLDDDKLWKIVCNRDDKFKVVVNARHPFYSKMYKSTANRALTNALDAFIFSLAFAELYNKNDQNAHLFDTYKSVCSQALERLIEEDII